LKALAETLWHQKKMSLSNLKWDFNSEHFPVLFIYASNTEKQRHLYPISFEIKVVMSSWLRSKGSKT
jgi:hypothetical protein